MKKVSDVINGLKNFDIHRGAAVFLASAFKAHVAEDGYDKVAETPTFKRLQQLPPGKKALVDGAFHSLAAACEQLFGENTFFGKVFKEVAEDTGPELSKRLNNGAESQQPAIAIGAVAPSVQRKNNLANVLMELSENDLESFMDWIDTTTPEERANTLKYICNFPAEKILGIAKLKPKNRERLFSLSEEPKVEPPKRITFLDAVERGLRQHRDSLSQQKGGGENGKN